MTTPLRVALLTHPAYGGAAVLREMLQRGRRPVMVVAETGARSGKKAKPGTRRTRAQVVRAKILELGRVHALGFFVARAADRGLRLVGLGSPDPFGLRFLRAAEKTWLRVLHGVLYGYPPGAYDASERRIWSVDELCRAHGIPYHLVRSLNAKEARALLEEAHADVFVLSGTRVLKPETLALARRRALNKHSSLLPAYRGRKAEFWTLYHKDLERLGVTVHEVDPGLDTGAILLQERMSFGPHDSHVSLRIRSQDLGARLLSDALERLEREPGWRGTPQPDGDWRTYRAPTLDELTQYRGRLQELRREAGGKP